MHHGRLDYHRHHRYARVKFENNRSHFARCLWRNRSWQVENLSIFILNCIIVSGLTVLAVPFLTPALRRHALPYVPATRIQLDNIFHLLKQYSSKPRDHLIDLGSGDGRIVKEVMCHCFSPDSVSGI